MFSSKIRYYPWLPLSRDIKAFKWLLVTWYSWISRISMAVRVPTWLKTWRIVCPSSVRKIEHSTNAEVSSGHPRQREKRVTRTIAMRRWKNRGTRCDNRKKRGFNLVINIRYGIIHGVFDHWSHAILAKSRKRDRNALSWSGLQKGLGKRRRGEK